MAPRGQMWVGSGKKRRGGGARETCIDKGVRIHVLRNVLNATNGRDWLALSPMEQTLSNECQRRERKINQSHALRVFKLKSSTSSDLGNF